MIIMAELSLLQVSLQLLRFEVLFILYGISCLRRVTLSIDDGLHRVGNDLQERFGGCLLSPGQRYLEISPPQVGMQLPQPYQ